MEFPHLSIGANHHHERFDGRGYPDKLKGDDIPELARIIAVADAYDAMTSKRSYRDPLPQATVRQILIEEMGAQFDPELATQMVHIIDRDQEYNMREKEDIKEFSGNDEFNFEANRTFHTEGIINIPNIDMTIHVRISPLEDHGEDECIPLIVLFDSLDGRVHDTEKLREELLYTEYAVLGYDGSFDLGDARMIVPKITGNVHQSKVCGEYDIESVRVKDHLLLKITGEGRQIEYTVALTDSTRYCYISFSGENYHIEVTSIKRSEESVPDNYIPRIAELVSYIGGEAGNIPNVQVDGYRTDATSGVLLKDSMDIDFHSKSLPTARLIWHCPFVCLFNSTNGKVTDDDYKEFALIRFDGEVWETADFADNDIIINKNDSFDGWDKWKKLNKDGMDCHVHLKRDGKRITMNTDNGGIFLKCITTIKTDDEDVYVALTGDQIALTKIFIN